MVGSNICGFYPQPTEELCNRWIELGAFYPFSSDHANYYSPRQQLYVWDTVATSARNALGMRYKLLAYLYTLGYEAHTTGAPIERPLFFYFPNYTECYGLSTQFLLGHSLMGVRSKGGQYFTLDTPLNVVNAHFYQNAIIPMLEGGMTSKEARMTPCTLVVTLPIGAPRDKLEEIFFSMRMSFQK
ncbi:NAD(P)H-dependent D-xylose reductase (XR) [Ancistrocladus abbreviatus]